MEKVLRQAALAGSKIHLKYFGKKLKISKKTSHQDYFTRADIESQDAIRNEIIGQAAKIGIPEKEIGFIGEENLNKASRKHLFIIDPLDGTTNFESGLDYFAISIAYCLNGEIQEGLIYRPTTKDFYYAQKNHGAFKNGQRLSISPKPLESCLVDGIISSRPNIYPKMFKIFQNLFPHIKGFRSLFCMTLSNCLIAENIINVSINGHTFIWDIAAASLIVREAGGTITDFNGHAIEFDFDNPKKPYQTVSCHPAATDFLTKVIKV